jgi:hypothetical protein
VVEIPHLAAVAEEAAAGNHRPEAEEGAAGNHRPEAEEAADTHRVEEEADTHRMEAEEEGSYQGAVAVDQSWTPSSDEISWQRAC